MARVFFHALKVPYGVLGVSPHLPPRVACFGLTSRLLAVAQNLFEVLDGGGPFLQGVSEEAPICPFFNPIDLHRLYYKRACDCVGENRQKKRAERIPHKKSLQLHVTRRTRQGRGPGLMMSTRVTRNIFCVKKWETT